MDNRPLRMQLGSLRERQQGAVEHHSRIETQVRRARKITGNVPSALFSEFIRSRDRLHQLSRQIRQGEAERDYLVNTNQGLVHQTARFLINGSAFLRSRLALEDAIQEGEVAELRAAEKWDPEGEANFCTYATRAVHNAIIQKARAESRGPRVPQYVSLLFKRQREGEKLKPGQVDCLEKARHAQLCRSLPEVFDWPARDEDEQPESDASDLLREAMEKLEPRDRRVLKRYYWDKLTYEAIGELEGVSKQRIEQLLRCARARLKVLLEAQTVGAL